MDIDGVWEDFGGAKENGFDGTDGLRKAGYGEARIAGFGTEGPEGIQFADVLMLHFRATEGISTMV